MFEAFQRSFPRDPWQRPEGGALVEIPAASGLREFFSAFGGASFRGGLYRAIHPADLSEWKERINLAFPQFDERITCFGYDWLGRTFALDSKRSENGQLGVIMFEPGTGEALEIPSNLQTFHDAGLMEFGEVALAISFYEKWAAIEGVQPFYTQCIGYKKPLFLGGVDEVENLEVSDLNVYWHIMGQLIQKTTGLPAGTPVRVRMD
jgi:type VI secretion system (T6SS) immunity protein Tdi1